MITNIRQVKNVNLHVSKLTSSNVRVNLKLVGSWYSINTFERVANTAY